MRRYIIFIIVFLAGLGGAIFFFWPRGHTQTALWRFVPANALWVYEHPHLAALWYERLQGHPVEDLLESFLAFSLQEHGTSFWEQWQGDEAALREFMTALPVKMSGHNLADRRMGVVFYAQINEAKIETLRRLFAPLSQGDFVLSNRTYRGYELHEIHTVDNEQQFVYLIGRDYFVGSFSPILLEEVVRTANLKQKAPYLAPRQHLLASTPIESEDGTLYLSVEAMQMHWRTLWGQADKVSGLIPARYQDAAAMLQAHLLPSHLSWSGLVTAPDTSQQRLLAGFADNAPLPVGYLHMVPNGCVVLHRYGFGDAMSWNLDMQELWQQQQHPLLSKRLALFSQYGIDIDELFGHIGHMTARLKMEAPRGTPLGKLWLLHVQDPKTAMQALAQVSAQIKTSSTQYREQYRGHIIQYLELRDLPYLLFGEDFAGFLELFYTQRDGFLLASSSLLTLKSALDQLEAEESWGRTPAWQAQLSHGIDNASFSIEVNLFKQWNTLREDLRYPWYPFFENHSIAGNQPHFFSLQMSVLEDKFYTQVRLYAPPMVRGQTPPLVATPQQLQQVPPPLRTPVDTLPIGYQQQAARTFNTPLMTKPLLVYHPTRKRFERFVQEQAEYRLHALDDAANSRWDIPLQERIISPIYAMDYFKSGLTQYLFATVAAIYVVDEQGATLPGFPVRLPTADSIAYLNLLDYNKKKQYRFFVSDVHGRTYVLSKEGTPLPGWDPNNLQRLAQAPFHVRIGQQDCMVLPQSDGFLHMYRRIGTSYPNFPVRVGAAFGGVLHIEKGPARNRSYFVALNTQGELLRISFTGNVAVRRPIYPILNDATYQLLPSVLGNSYVCVVANDEKVVVLSAADKLLFEKARFLSPDFVAQYYDLGTNRSLIAFQDKIQEQVYFYDLRGEEALPSPIAASHKIALTYSRSKDTYTLYVSQQNKYLQLDYKK